VGGMAGVTAAAAATSLPQNIGVPSDSFTVDARPPAPGEARPRAAWVAVSPGYLDALKAPLVRGRFFDASDGAGAAPVAVVSRGLAERVLAGADPVGQRITFQGVSRTVVGVIGDVRQSIVSFRESSQATIYVPLAQHPSPALVLFARTGADPHALLPVLRRELVDTDRRLIVSQVLTMKEFVDRFYVGLDLFNAILTGFGLLALLLAAVGTYGVLAYNVAERRHEIGVRMALGAARGRVLSMFARQGVTLALIGLAIGAPGVVAIDRFVRSLLSIFSAVPAPTMLGVASVLFAATLVASVVPAWRAATIDPVKALRNE
jgi:predicted permease